MRKPLRLIAAAAALSGIGYGITAALPGSTCACSTPTFATPDTTAPTVAITAPVNSATVSGSAVTVSATAADAVGVFGVQFKLDGSNYGSEDLVAPYTISWDSTASSNASHSLTAVARDAAGNSTTSATVTVTVSNSSAGTGTHNVWISTTGNDLGASCVRNASPVTFAANGTGCLSVTRALAIAQSGDTVGVQTGSYSAVQNIALNSALTNFVTFVPEGGTVTWANYICVGASSGSNGCTANAAGATWIKFDANGGTGNFLYPGSIGIWYKTSQPNHVTFNGGHTHGITFSSVANLTISNMEVGPDCCSADGIHSSWQPGQPQMLNLVFTNNRIHGITRLCSEYPGQMADGIGPLVCPGDTTVHVDGIQLDTANNVTFSGNNLWDNAEQGMFFGGTGSGGPVSSCPNTGVVGCYEGTVTIENNMLGAPLEAGNNAFIIGRNAQVQPDFAAAAVFNIRYNSIPSSYVIQGTDIPGTVTFVGNIGDWPTFVACNGDATTETFSHNFFTGKTCGATDTLLSNFTTSYTNTAAATSDFHLLAGAPELGGGDPAYCPALDIDGQTRVVPCDAGADER